jgi:neopullulanase
VSQFLPARSRFLVCLILAVLFVRPAGVCLGLAQTAEAESSASPRIEKLDPPNWWTSFSPHLMLLLTGANLDGAKIATSYPGVRVTKTESGASSHYLFLWLELARTVAPGEVPLQIQTHHGRIVVEFPLLRHSPEQSPRGVSTNDVIYLIMPDRFADGDPTNDKPPNSTGIYDRSQPKAYHGGDLRGIREHLAYLHDLGVTALWLTPVWKNTDSDYHGYHVVDFYAIDDHMGSLREYQDLVADAHKLGMKVLIDYVVNHTGPHHRWATDPPLSDWFHGSPDKHVAAAYNFDGLTDPHASPNQYRDVIEGWFVDKLPDLNTDEVLVETYLCENALWWAETADVDGFRLDTFPYSSRRSWSRWHAGMRQEYPGLVSIGEVADKDPTITSFFEGGRSQFDGVDSGVTTVFDFPLQHVLRDVILRGASVQEIVEVLRHDSLYPHSDNLVTFIGNHDDARFMGEAGSSPEKLKNAFSLLLTMRGIPQIYAGDEIGMSGGEDPDNRRDFPGGFPGDPRNAFLAVGRTGVEEDVYEHVQALLHLRQAHPALQYGRQCNIGWDDSYLAFTRETAEEKVLVMFNNSSGVRNVSFSIEGTPLQNVTQVRTLYGTAKAALNANQMQTMLPPESVTIYEIR